MSTSYAHMRLVELTTAQMRNNGMTGIKASHILDFAQCDQIGNFIPDATAFSGNAFVVAAAESQEGLPAVHTVDQWLTFYTYTTRYGGHFIAVVNKADEAAARSLLTQVCGNAINSHLWVF